MRLLFETVNPYSAVRNHDEKVPERHFFSNLLIPGIGNPGFAILISLLV